MISLQPGQADVFNWILRRLLGDWPDPDQKKRIARTERVIATAHDMIPEIERVAAMRASARRAQRRLHERRT